MDVKLHLPSLLSGKTIAITGSKSETNRLLLLKALYPGINILNASESDDSKVMQEAVTSGADTIDVHHAGTAMRFLTAYFATLKDREVVLTGSQRMRERPIGVLVEALRDLGAEIEYLEHEGFPPLRIRGRELMGGKVTVHAGVSSQYLTALMLIGPKLKNGLELALDGETTSMPYLLMTISLLRKIGAKVTFRDAVINIEPLNDIASMDITVESDWSSASYYYSITALAYEGFEIVLTSFRENSLQGDSALASIYKHFGVVTEYDGNAIILKKVNVQLSAVSLQLNDTPDIAQTIAVTCFGLGIPCSLTGLHTLKIKETDRLAALKTELEKLGAGINITEDSLTLEASGRPVNYSDVAIDTYNDHRMAMAFAPLAIKSSLVIRDAEVVSKSYPAFWEDFKKLGFNVVPAV